MASQLPSTDSASQPVAGVLPSLDPGDLYESLPRDSGEFPDASTQNSAPEPHPGRNPQARSSGHVGAEAPLRNKNVGDEMRTMSPVEFHKALQTQKYDWGWTPTMSVDDITGYAEDSKLSCFMFIKGQGSIVNIPVKYCEVRTTLRWDHDMVVGGATDSEPASAPARDRSRSKGTRGAKRTLTQAHSNETVNSSQWPT